MSTPKPDLRGPSKAAGPFEVPRDRLMDPASRAEQLAATADHTGRIPAPVEPERSMRASFWLLIAVQLLSAVNDNLFRWFVVSLAQTKYDAAWTLAIGGLCFILPYLFLTPLAGSLSDRYAKRDVILMCKAAEVGILALGVLFVVLRSPVMLFAVVAMMGAQSALFAPAKYGAIPEYLTRNKLPRGNAAMGLVTVGGTALGTVAGYEMFVLSELSLLEPATFWQITKIATAMLGVSGLGLAAAYLMRRVAPADPERPLLFDPVTETLPALRLLSADRVLLWTALGIAFFWSAGTLAQLAIDVFGEATLDLSRERIGWLSAVLVVGVGAGSVLAGLLCGERIELGLVPIGAAGIAAGSLVVFWAGVEATNSDEPASWTWMAYVGLGLLGLSSGLFDIPLEAHLQAMAPARIRGTILAGSNFVVFAGMAASCVLFLVMTSGFGWSATSIFLLAALGTLPVVVYAFFLLPSATLRLVNYLLTHSLYRVRLKGLENIPAEGGALLVSNHISWSDGFLLLAVSPRPVRFLVYSTYVNYPVARFIARTLGIIPIDAHMGPKQLMKSIRGARDAIANGEIVCVFPEGQISRTGQLQPFQKGFTRLIQGTDAPVIPVYLAGLWGSILSFRGGKFFWKLPRKFPYPVTIHVGRPVDEGREDPPMLRRAVERLGSEAMSEHNQKDAFFLPRFLRACKAARFRRKVVDSTGVELTGGKLAAGVLAMKRVLDRHEAGQNPRIGVLLPPTVACSVLNAAPLLRGQTVVNLNYTLSAEDMNYCVKKAGLTHVITSRKFLEKKPYELEAEFVFAEDLKTQVTGLDKAVAAFDAFVTPAALLCRKLGLHKRSPDEVATIVFTSGSTGMPKGVCLSYANVASQLLAIDQLFHLTASDCVLGVLPVFHSYGYSDAMWMPLCSPTAAAFHTNPLDAKTVGQMCEKYDVTIAFATPTFLRSYMRRCKPEQLAKLDLVVVGAEKSPPELFEEFHAKFGVTPTEGYGATELSPFTAVNVPDHRSVGITQKGTKPGSVGRVMPGSTARTVDPDTGEETGLGEEGLLLIKGPNVMLGYLDEPEKTAEVIRDGWYDTGDLAVIDADGFIEITGRRSRFSKIGGEMVPHIRVEQAIERAVVRAMGERTPEDLDTDEEVGQAVAVSSVPDERKGERLIVLHRPLPVDANQILAELDSEGLPNLWTPSADAFVEVSEIPLLGTGKLDLKRLKELAAEKTA